MNKYLDLLLIGDIYVNVSTIDKESCVVHKNKLVGFCHSKRHPGYLTVANIKKHDCIKKNCYFFEKYDSLYWDKPHFNFDYRENSEQKTKLNDINFATKPTFRYHTIYNNE